MYSQLFFAIGYCNAKTSSNKILYSKQKNYFDDDAIEGAKEESDSDPSAERT